MSTLLFAWKNRTRGTIDARQIVRLYGYSTFDRGTYVVRHQSAGRLFVRVDELGRILFPRVP